MGSNGLKFIRLKVEGEKRNNFKNRNNNSVSQTKAEDFINVETHFIFSEERTVFLESFLIKAINSVENESETDKFILLK